MKKLLLLLLVVVLLGLVFGVLIPSFASYEEIVASMGALSVVQWIILATVFIGLEILKSAPPAAMVDRMTVRQSFMANESAAVVSNVIPGPSGFVARVAVYQAYGLDLVDITRASVVNSALNQAVTLLLPFGALIIIILQGSVPAAVWALTGAATAALLMVVAVVWRLFRSEGSARWLGGRVGSLFSRLEGLRGKTTDRDWGDAATDVRRQLIDGLQAHGPQVLVLHLARHTASVALLFFSLRFAGVTGTQLGAGDIFIVYSFTLLVTLIPLTPGGVGVAEATLITIGVAIATEGAKADITAGVLIYRAFTYIGPMLLGVGCIVARKRLMGETVAVFDDGTSDEGISDTSGGDTPSATRQ